MNFSATETESTCDAFMPAFTALPNADLTDMGLTTFERCGGDADSLLHTTTPLVCAHIHQV